MKQIEHKNKTIKSFNPQVINKYENKQTIISVTNTII